MNYYLYNHINFNIHYHYVSHKKNYTTHYKDPKHIEYNIVLVHGNTVSYATSHSFDINTGIDKKTPGCNREHNETIKR